MRYDYDADDLAQFRADAEADEYCPICGLYRDCECSPEPVADCDVGVYADWPVAARLARAALVVVVREVAMSRIAWLCILLFALLVLILSVSRGDRFISIAAAAVFAVAVAGLLRDRP